MGETCLGMRCAIIVYMLLAHLAPECRTEKMCTQAVLGSRREGRDGGIGERQALGVDGSHCSRLRIGVGWGWWAGGRAMAIGRPLSHKRRDSRHSLTERVRGLR